MALISLNDLKDICDDFYGDCGRCPLWFLCYKPAFRELTEKEIKLTETKLALYYQDKKIDKKSTT